MSVLGLTERSSALLPIHQRLRLGLPAVDVDGGRDLPAMIDWLGDHSAEPL